MCMMQALCTEASLQALRRSYPQIYESDDKLLINPERVNACKADFLAAHAGIVPAAHRQAASHARCVCVWVKVGGIGLRRARVCVCVHVRVAVLMCVLVHLHKHVCNSASMFACVCV